MTSSKVFSFSLNCDLTLSFLALSSYFAGDKLAKSSFFCFNPFKAWALKKVNPIDLFSAGLK